jgi:hypothetical protein
VILAYVAAMVLSIVFGISLILSGSYFWGVLLLAFGSFLVIQKIVAWILRHYRKKKKLKEAHTTVSFTERSHHWQRSSRMSFDDPENEDTRPAKEVLRLHSAYWLLLPPLA